MNFWYILKLSVGFTDKTMAVFMGNSEVIFEEPVRYLTLCLQHSHPHHCLNKQQAYTILQGHLKIIKKDNKINRVTKQV